MRVLSVEAAETMEERDMWSRIRGRMFAFGTSSWMDFMAERPLDSERQPMKIVAFLRTRWRMVS